MRRSWSRMRRRRSSSSWASRGSIARLAHSTSESGLKGLATYSRMPSCQPRIWSSSPVRAVSSTTGMSAVASSSFRRRRTSHPSISGIIRSRKITSGCWLAATSRARDQAAEQAADGVAHPLEEAADRRRRRRGGRRSAAPVAGTTQDGRNQAWGRLRDQRRGRGSRATGGRRGARGGRRNRTGRGAGPGRASGGTGARRGDARGDRPAGTTTEAAEGVVYRAQERRPGHLLVEGDQTPTGALGAEGEHVAPPVGEGPLAAVDGDGGPDERVARRQRRDEQRLVERTLTLEIGQELAVEAGRVPLP